MQENMHDANDRTRLSLAFAVATEISKRPVPYSLERIRHEQARLQSRVHQSLP